MEFIASVVVVSSRHMMATVLSPGDTREMVRLCDCRAGLAHLLHRETSKGARQHRESRDPVPGP